MKAVLSHPLVNLLISLVVLMFLMAGVKMALASAPDGGIIGDIKKILMLA